MVPHIADMSEDCANIIFKIVSHLVVNYLSRRFTALVSHKVHQAINVDKVGQEYDFIAFWNPVALGYGECLERLCFYFDIFSFDSHSLVLGIEDADSCLFASENHDLKIAHWHIDRSRDTFDLLISDLNQFPRHRDSIDVTRGV